MSRPQEAAALRPQAERKTHPARAKRPKPVIPTETTLHPPSDVQKLPYPARLPKDEKDEVPGLRLDKSLFRKTLNLCAIKVPAKLSGELVRDERVNR